MSLGITYANLAVAAVAVIALILSLIAMTQTPQHETGNFETIKLGKKGQTFTFSTQGDTLQVLKDSTGNGVYIESIDSSSKSKSKSVVFQPVVDTEKTEQYYPFSKP